MSENRVMRLPEVMSRTGLSRSTIYLLMADNAFPAPAKIGKRAVGWSSASIDQWIEQRFMRAA